MQRTFKINFKTIKVE